MFMSLAVEPTERRDRILTELSELGLDIARDLHARALAAETPEAAGELALAFQRVSRSVRQTLALEAKLERDRARQDREDRADAAREHTTRIHRRRTQVRLAVERAIWTEAEGDEAERLVDDLDDLLDERVLDDDFDATPLDAQIDRIRADLGLPTLADTPAPIPETAGLDHPGATDWRSSA
jgi:hypothetical protein